MRADCIEPEGLRRLFELSIASEVDCDAELEMAIDRALEMMQAPGGETYLGEYSERDELGEYVPGIVLRDITITLGQEVLAILKVSDHGPYVIRLPRADLGRSFAEDVLVLEHGAEPYVEWDREARSLTALRISSP
jgi:hypothetical protein